MFVHWVYIMIATPTLLRKSAVIALELACLSIDICMLSETWLTGTGSIWEGHYTFWSGYPDGSRPRHGSSGFAGRNTLLPCMENLVAVSPRLMTLQLSSGYLAVLSAYALALLPPLRKKMHSTISCPGLSDWSGRATVLTCRWLQCLYWYRLIPPGPVHLVHLEYGTWTKIVNVCLSCALSSICLADTYFASSTNSKVTWMHPRSRRWHQLDHVIVRRQVNEVSHCHSMHSADCNTDHALVCCKLALQARKFHLSRSRPSPSMTALQPKTLLKWNDFRFILQPPQLILSCSQGSWRRLDRIPHCSHRQCCHCFWSPIKKVAGLVSWQCWLALPSTWSKAQI